MQHAMISPRVQRRRQMLLVLPLLVIPFITLAFWALGGGKIHTSTTFDSTNIGLNMQVPDAHFKKDKVDNKLAYYERAAFDSMKIKEALKADPYAMLPMSDSLPVQHSTAASYEATEKELYMKLEKLQRETQQPAPVPSTEGSRAVRFDDMDEVMTRHAAAADIPQEDPQLKQLDGMLNKILDIQHPERLKETREVVHVRKEGALMLEVRHSGPPVTIMKDGEDILQTASMRPNDLHGNMIEAVVHTTQTIVPGAVVKLRLLRDAMLGSRYLPKDHFVYGVASLNNERLTITVTSIRNHNDVLAVNLQAYDYDGLHGLYVPGAITRDVVKQSTDNAIQSVALNSLDPSLGAQAAAAGIETARKLLSKKVRQVKVQVKAGYHVFLKDASIRP